jgi:energy-converting hydrogenase Eha subunit B
MALNQTNNFRIVTPHAAIIIWNYDNRLGSDPTNAGTINDINETILSTLSLQSIQTSKSKSSPAGSFTVNLAPTRDWVSQITAGSWCAILMSNNPISPTQLAKADPKFVKMIGKIESVRADIQIDEEGARHTTYTMTGTDWGYIFNNVLYIDNLISAANTPTNQGNAIAIALQKQLFGDGNTPQSFKVVDNLVALLGIFGSSSPELDKASGAINRINKSIYDFLIPTKMAQYFNFVDGDGNINPSTKLSDLLTLQVGKLVAQDQYADTNEAYGFIDPFSLQGTNTFWQIMMDNSNPALNEMYNEIDWETNNSGTVGPSLTIFNRIKPFSYRTDLQSSAAANKLKSPFTLLKTHVIDNVKVTSVNIGTNWRDKYNFVEIRPLFQDFEILNGWTAQKSQGSDTAAFNREGFRPMIVGTKQFPVDISTTSSASSAQYNADMLTSWVELLKEWFFDTHRLLNGTLVMRGTTEYIGVGNNILFEAGLINPTMNLNQGANTNTNTNYVLAHVENVNHTFTVSGDGGRTYITTIQFVRGLVVNKANGNYTLVGSGSLDELASDLQNQKYKNTVNTVSTSDPSDPDPNKVRGQ